MNRNMVMGVVRTVLATVGGAIAARGYADEQSVNEIGGALLTLIAGIWSVVEKRRAMQAAGVAAPGSTPAAGQ